MYQVGMKGKKYIWERCTKKRCSGMGKVQQGPSPFMGGAKKRCNMKKSRCVKNRGGKHNSKCSKRRSTGRCYKK